MDKKPPYESTVVFVYNEQNRKAYFIVCVLAVVCNMIN